MLQGLTVGYKGRQGVTGSTMGLHYCCWGLLVVYRAWCDRSYDVAAY